jgi:hypothetical protein
MRTHNRELFRLLRSLYLHLLGISIQCQAALQLSIVISTVLASIGELYAIYGSIAAQYRHPWNICTFLPSVAGAFAYAQHQLEYAKPDCNRAVVHTL